MPNRNPLRKLSDHMGPGVFAYDSDRSFDVERMPYRFVDRSTRVGGIGMVAGAAVLLVVLGIIFLEERYGNPVSSDPGDPRTFEYILGTLAALLAVGGAWLWPRSNVLEITSEHVRVSERRLFGGGSWVTPLSEYRLVYHSYFERNAESDWGDDSYTWTILLDHDRYGRRVFLRSRTLLISAFSDGLKEIDGGVTDESISSVTEEFLATSVRWARALDLPLLRREDFGEPQLLRG